MRNPVFSLCKRRFLSPLHLADPRSPTNPSKNNAIFNLFASAYTQENALPITHTNLAHHHTTPEKRDSPSKKSKWCNEKSIFFTYRGQKKAIDIFSGIANSVAPPLCGNKRLPGEGVFAFFCEIIVHRFKHPGGCPPDPPALPRLIRIAYASSNCFA